MEKLMIPASYTLSGHAQVSTLRASTYLQRLCKHFNHRVSASWGEAEGWVMFDMGISCWYANDAQLRVSCFAADASALAEVIETVDRHFERFAKAEEIRLSWSQAS